MKSSDEEVARYLRLFTFLPLPDIDLVMNKHMQDPSKRIAQHLLAKEFVSLVHSPLAAKNAEADHNNLFSGGSATLNLDAIKIIREKPKKVEYSDGGDLSPSLNTFAPQVNAQNAPSKYTTLPKSMVLGSAFPQILYASGLVASRSEGHRLVSAQGAYVAGQPDEKMDAIGNSLTWSAMKHFETDKPQKYLIDGKMLVLRVGKWNIRMCHVMEDEEFEAQGLTCPGWEEFRQKQKEKADQLAGEEKLAA
jgi:tyrosyl-tRNA synthetase